MPSFIPRFKAPTSLIGVAKAMCHAPLFSTEPLAISGIQPIIMFCLVVTLCENGGTPKVMVRSKDIFVLHVIPYLVYEANYTKVSKVQLKSWHVAMTKLHDLLARPSIDQTNVLFRVLVVYNEGMV